MCLVEECLPADDQSEVVDEDIGLERVWLVVDNLRRGDPLLVLDELLDLFVEGVLGALLLFGQALLPEWVLLLRVVVTLALLGVKERV